MPEEVDRMLELWPSLLSEMRSGGRPECEGWGVLHNAITMSLDVAAVDQQEPCRIAR